VGGKAVHIKELKYIFSLRGIVTLGSAFGQQPRQQECEGDKVALYFPDVQITINDLG